MSQTNLPLAQTANQQALWNKLQPVNRVAATDTYKRTMSGSSDLFANNFACYNLAARRATKEEGANGRLVIAGLEKTLYPFFLNPITEQEVRQAEQFFTQSAQVRKFPSQAWQAVIDNDGYMPVDVWSVPGGQTLLAKDGKHVPVMSVEGIGALVSHLEPQMLTIYESIIQATKARLFSEVTPAFAEFGLRADRNLNNHVGLMLALYVGGGYKKTSDDQAVFLFPELFEDIGTMGHEFVMAYQQEGISLEQAQQRAYEAFVAANDRAALLPDTIDTMRSGLPEILKQKRDNLKKTVMPRFDSGDVTQQSLHWTKLMQQNKLDELHVIEDGRTPAKAQATKDAYEQADFPYKVIEGAGGYFQRDVTRDILSMAYKRSATEHDGTLETSLKFSDSPGKESVPGQIRIYERGDTLIVAQAGESIEGKLLSRKVVDNGHIVYDEHPETQHERANQTWNQYGNIEYSPRTQALIDARLAERDEICARYEVQQTTGVGA